MSCKNSAKVALLFVFVNLLINSIDAQQNDSLIQNKIKSQQYFFVPQTASSSTMTVEVTTIEYGIRIEKDSVIAVLPYNGRSYSIQNTLADRQIKFVSTNFKYTSVAKKKGKWEIAIEPNDTKGIRVYLVIFRDGIANVDVMSPGNETMSYKGYVR